MPLRLPDPVLFLDMLHHMRPAERRRLDTAFSTGVFHRRKGANPEEGWFVSVQEALGREPLALAHRVHDGQSAQVLEMAAGTELALRVSGVAQLLGLPVRDTSAVFGVVFAEPERDRFGYLIYPEAKEPMPVDDFMKVVTNLATTGTGLNIEVGKGVTVGARSNRTMATTAAVVCVRLCRELSEATQPMQEALDEARQVCAGEAALRGAMVLCIDDEFITDTTLQRLSDAVTRNARARQAVERGFAVLIEAAADEAEVVELAEWVLKEMDAPSVPLTEPGSW